MNDDIFRTVRELLDSRGCVLTGNAVDPDGQLYDDSVENLEAILAMKERYVALETALDALVVNYAQFGRVTDRFVSDVAELLQEVDA
jgi:hypothetical protein